MLTPPRRAHQIGPVQDALAQTYHRSLALRWLATVLAMPVLVPLLLARGLELTQLGLIMATFAAVTAALEVPTGGFADAFGRVRMTLVADALALVSRLAFMLAPDLTGLLVAAVLGGVARALGSGSLEAWYVDARRVRTPDEDLVGSLARAGVVQSLALALGALVGGALPLAAPLLGLGEAGSVRALQLAFAVSIAIGAVSLLVIARLPEARTSSPAKRRSARPDLVARVAVRALCDEPGLRALVLVGAALGGVVMSFEAFYPAELRARWDGAGVSTVLGVIMAGGFGATALGQGWSARRATRARSPLLPAIQGSALMAVGTALLALTSAAPSAGLVVAAVAAWSTYLGLGYGAPSLAAAFHARVDGADRATLLSVRSLAGYLGGVVASLAFGSVASAFGLALVWAAVASIAAAVTMGLLLWNPAPAAALAPLGAKQVG